MEAFFDLARIEPCGGASIGSEGGVTVIRTPPGQWNYAASISRLPSPAKGKVIVLVDCEVRAGRVGIGCLRTGTQQFLREVEVDRGGGPGTVSLLVNECGECGDLIVRNTTPDGAVSEVVIRSVKTIAASAQTMPYLVSVAHRPYEAEPTPEFLAGQVFNDDLATTINKARLEHLISLGLPLSGRRVLDAGCGIGHFADFFSRQGCRVVGVDGRAENIAEMARRYPQIEGHVADVQNADFTSFGEFDLVHCYGLLYHLDSPVGALRRLSAVCRDLMVVETMVCDSSEPIMVLVDENKSANQALAGLACRPSPSFIAMTLNRIGFRHVYGVATPPRHEDFEFEWRDNMEYGRDGHNLRCVFVASRSSLDSPQLVPLIS